MPTKSEIINRVAVQFGKNVTIIAPTEWMEPPPMKDIETECYDFTEADHQLAAMIANQMKKHYQAGFEMGFKMGATRALKTEREEPTQ